MDSDEVRYKLTGAEFDLEFSAQKAGTRKELAKVLKELIVMLEAKPIPEDRDI